MADTKLTIFQSDGTTAAIDYRTESTSGDGRQVIVLGDPAVNDNVVNVVTADPGGASTTPGIVFRMAGSVVLANSSNTINVRIAETAGTMAVRVGQVDGTVAVYFSQANPAVNAQFGNIGHTASIFTVSGSTSGVSPSGVQLVAPSANYSYKVFAFSLQTTGIVSTVARFTNGGGSATEFWRGLVTSNQTSSTPIGANLAVPPPSFLFATGTSTTLALHLDNSTLVHYSVSYIKETA